MFASFKLNPNSTIMEKTPRYTQRERNMVLSYAAQYKDIIENKRTDAESNRKKDEVWTTIAKEFNSRVYHQRTAKQLRQLYKNMKLLLKKDLSTDGRSESFLDILTALQSHSGSVPLLAHHYSDGRSNGKIRQNNNDKSNSSQMYNNSSPNIESDVVIIKSEDLSDNDQSFKNEMDDDSLSNKDIPEVCLEEDEDDAIFDPSCINPVASYLNLQPNSNHHSNNSNNNNNHQNNQQQSQSQTQSNLTPHIQLQQIIQQHQQQQQQRQQEIAQNHQQSKHLRDSRAPSLRREISHSPEPLNFTNSNDDRYHSNHNHHSRKRNNSSSFSHMNGERLHTIQLSNRNGAGRKEMRNKSPPLHHYDSPSNSPPSMNGDDHGIGGLRNNDSTNGTTESLFALAIEERKRKIELLNAQIEYWKTLTKKIKMSNSSDTDLSAGLCNGTCPCSHSVPETPTSTANTNTNVAVVATNNTSNNNDTNNSNNNNNNSDKICITNISSQVVSSIKEKEKEKENTCNNNNDSNVNNNINSSVVVSDTNCDETAEQS